MPKRTAGRTHPAHADVWVPHVPVWTSRKRRLAVAAVIVAAVLGSVGGAGVTARRVDAAEQHPAGASGPTQLSENPDVAGAPLLGTPGEPGSSSPIGVPPVSGTPTLPGHTADPTPSGPLAPDLAGDGIPAVALDAYRKAAAGAPSGCGIPWPLLAAIGRVESDHGRFAGSQLYADGTSAPRVIGIPLNGHGTALIRDTDHGALDGDTVYDRAVGPMQFIPSTWATWGIDGNGDGVANPFNIYDAAQAAADYLCSAGGNLQTASGQIRAVLAYNHSDAYLTTVLSLEKVYADGVPGVTIPLLPSNPKPKPHDRPLPPPVDPGRPAGLPPQRKPTTSHTGSGSHSTPPTGGSSTPPSTVDKVPTAALTVSQKTQSALDVVADASGSRDDHGIVSYSFDFGDGTAATPAGAGTTATHTYAAAGTYTVKVTVTDTAGHETVAASKVTVDTPPTAELTVAAKSDNPLAVTADASKSTDNDGAGIVSYTYDFGDSTPPQPQTTTAATLDHTYAKAGTYTVTVTVTDKDHKTATKTFQVTVTAPTSTGTTTTSDTPTPSDSTTTG